MSRRQQRAARAALAVVILLMLPMLAGPAEAIAASESGSTSPRLATWSGVVRLADPDSYSIGRSGYQSVCQSADSETPADSTLLSVNRWGDVADTFHDRLDADFWSDVFEKLQRRQLFSTMMQAGNSMW